MPSANACEWVLVLFNAKTCIMYDCVVREGMKVCGAIAIFFLRKSLKILTK